MNFALLSRWFPGRRKPIRSRPPSSRRSRPRVEDLERRELLSGSPLFLLPTGSGILPLQVRFKPGAERILQVSQDGGVSFGEVPLVQNRRGLWSGLFSIPGAAGRPAAMVLVDDLNRDGLPDFVINGTDGLTIAVTQPDSSLSLYRPLPLSGPGLAPVSILTGDFNQDGRTDVLALSRSRAADQSQVHLMYGDPGTGFHWGASTFTDYAGAAPAVSELIQARQVDLAGFSGSDDSLAGTTAGWTQPDSNVTVLGGVTPDDSPAVPPPVVSKKAGNGRSDDRSTPARPAPTTTPPSSPDRDARQTLLTDDAKDQAGPTDAPRSEAASGLRASSGALERVAPGTAVLLDDAGEKTAPALHGEEAPPPTPSELVAAPVPEFVHAPVTSPTAAPVPLAANAEQKTPVPAVLGTVPGLGEPSPQPILDTPRLDEEAPRPGIHEQGLTTLASTDLWAWLSAGPLASTVFALGVIRSGEQPAPVEATPTDSPVDARLLVADIVRKSAETFTKIMAGAYVLFLARAAADEEEQGWVGMMLRGKSQEDVFAAFLATAEFDNRVNALVPSGTRDERFIESLYRLLLGRSATEVEMSAGLASLAQLGRAGLASLILRSAEYRKLQVEAMCLELHREASADEVSAWTESPFDLLTIRAHLAGI